MVPSSNVTVQSRAWVPGGVRDCAQSQARLLFRAHCRPSRAETRTLEPGCMHTRVTPCTPAIHLCTPMSVYMHVCTHSPRPTLTHSECVRRYPRRPTLYTRALTCAHLAPRLHPPEWGLCAEPVG